MPHKKSYITITDQFCGAGGSSQGARNYGRSIGGGVEIKLALNHWKLAIETHNTNFPDTDHDCTDISASDPRRYCSTDILITSPECTNHSLAKGKKIVQKQMDMFASGIMDPSAERSRATMWDVCRFAEFHSYNIIIVENVVDARKWVMFDAWLSAMYALGYEHKCVYINSMHCHPTPQSRDRMYIVFWKKGNKKPDLDFMPVAYCKKCCKDVHAIQTWKNPLKKFGKYRQQYVYCCSTCTSIVEPYYYAAFNAIDWSDIGTKIGDRKLKEYDKPFNGEYLLPLAPNTLTRVDFGLKKYGRDPYIIHAAYSDKARGVVRSLTDTSFTQTTFASQAIIINDQHSTGIDFRVNPVSKKFPTIPTEHNLKLITAIIDGNYDPKPSRASSINDELPTNTTLSKTGLLTHPFIINHNHSSKADSIDKSIGTQLASERYSLLTPPFIPIARGKSMSKPVTDPMTTQSQMINHGIVTTESWNSFIGCINAANKKIIESIGSVTTHERHDLISYKEPKIEDCYYRMLKPKEIKLAMAFDHDYTVLGSGKDQVKQLGNAVTPPAMEWLVGQCIKSLN